MELQELVTGAAQGQPEAQNELITRFYPRVQSIVHRQLEQDFRKRHRWILPLFSTRDIVQEVFAGVIQRLEDCDFPDEDALVAYLSTMVRNRLLDAVRFHEAGRRDSRRRESEPERGIDSIKADTSGETPELAAALAEQAELVRTVLDEFSERHRELLKLRLSEDQSYPAIAEQLGYASAETARQSFLDAQARLLVKLRARGMT